MHCGRLTDLDGFRHRNTDCEYRARAVAAVLRLDTTTLRLDEAPADRQTQAGAGPTSILRLDAIEFVEDVLEVAGRDARPLIRHFYHNDIAIVSRPNIDTAAGRRVFGGIVEQVEQH